MGAGSQLFGTRMKYLSKLASREQRFILSHSYGGFNSSSSVPIALGFWAAYPDRSQQWAKLLTSQARKQKRQEEEENRVT
jgi:hypothetical protein